MTECKKDNFCIFECKKLIEEFLDGKDISYFQEFPFKDLHEEKIKKYNGKYRAWKNCDNGTGIPHADSSRLARLIYYILWGNHQYTEYGLSNLTDADTSFSPGEDKYGGDTLITTKSFESDTTIGNFMILPKGKSGSQTLNTYRGFGSDFKDDLRKFLNVIRDLYEGKVEDPIWQELFDNEHNKLFFNTMGNFPNYIEFFMLEGWDTLEDEEFIKQRNQKICERLKKILRNNPDKTGIHHII